MSIFEQTPTPVNTIDQDFHMLETEFDLADGLNMARALSDEILDSNTAYIRNAERDKALRLVDADGSHGIQHYLLPGIPGTDVGDIDKIREEYGRQAHYYESDDHMVLRVGQGEMWMVPKDKNPYLTVTMSECSALIGHNKDNIVVAHISFSELDELDAVLEFMAREGITSDSMYAVASVGEFQKSQLDKLFGNRAVDTEYYTRNGLLTDHVLPFEYTPLPYSSESEWSSQSLAQVLVNNRGLLKAEFDLRTRFSAAFFAPHEEKGAFKAEHVIDFDA